MLTNAVLKSRGHDVRVLSSDVNNDVPHYSDYEFKSIPTSGISRVINAAFNFDAYKTARKILQEFKPDIVLLHTLSQPTASVLYTIKKYPAILFVHGPELYTKALLPWYLKKSDYRGGTYDLQDLTLRGRSNYYYFLYVCRPLYKFALPKIHKIVALSSYTKSMLETEGMRPTLIPNGVGLFEQKPLSLDSPQLLYAGRLEKFKGVDDLINALSDILEKFPNLTLRIAGSGEYTTELQALVAKLGLGNSVEFTGQLSRQQLEAAYARCTFFVLASTWPETFGKVGVEAMSVGRPVIATDVGGVQDWLHDGQNGFLVTPKHPEQIADKVIKLLQNPELAHKMAEQARQTSEAFSITQMATNIEQLCADVVQQSAANK